MTRAIERAGCRCEAFSDGATVRIDEWTAYEPDAVVHCGAPPPGDVEIVPNPVIVVEVLPPSTQSKDIRQKFSDYFRLPAVQHSLTIDATKTQVIHHRRAEGSGIETRTLIAGNLTLDPPGIVVEIADFYA